MWVLSRFRGPPLKGQRLDKVKSLRSRQVNRVRLSLEVLNEGLQGTGVSAESLPPTIKQQDGHVCVALSLINGIRAIEPEFFGTGGEAIENIGMLLKIIKERASRTDNPDDNFRSSDFVLRVMQEVGIPINAIATSVHPVIFAERLFGGDRFAQFQIPTPGIQHAVAVVPLEIDLGSREIAIEIDSLRNDVRTLTTFDIIERVLSYRPGHGSPPMIFELGF